MVLSLTLALALMAGQSVTTGQEIRVEPDPVQQGGMLLVEAASATPPTCEWLGVKAAMYPAAGGYRVLLPVDRMRAPGPAELVVRDESGRELARRNIVVTELDTGPVDVVRLPRDRMALQNDPRLEEESRLIAELLATRTATPLWSGAFAPPLALRGHGYGKQRRYEEARTRRRGGRGKRAPPFTGYHRGLDFSAEPGTPVRAANAGRVLAARRFVLPGNAVFLDHGEGVITSYFHMSALRVQPGQMVERGEVVGLVGSTGRSTGPHLHWSVHAQGQAVNPMAALALPDRLWK